MNGDLDETGGTKEPLSTGIDKLYPDDCGRDKDKGTGLLCFPDGELCKNSKNHGEASKMSRGDCCRTLETALGLAVRPIFGQKLKEF